MSQLHRLAAALWGLGGGIIASLCWFGPALAVLLGMSGASFLFAALNDWLYYLLGALFLGAGFYYQRRRQPAAVSLAQRRRNRWLFPLIMVGTAGAAYMTATFVVSPLLVSGASTPVAASHSTSSGAMPSQGDQTATLWQAELRIEGMTWVTWATEVEQVAGSQPGVKQVKVHYPQGNAVLVYDRSQTTAQKVIQAVQAQRPDLEIIIQADRPLPEERWNRPLELI